MIDPAGLEAFERSCRDTSRQLRRLPSDLRKAIAAEAQERVADPVAGFIADAWTGPWATELAAGTKGRKAADPTVAIVGSRPVVSGGAAVRDLVYGTEWGGGKRTANVNRERYTSADVAAAPRGSRIKAGQRRRGKVTAAERARAPRRIYRRRTTMQFVANHHPAIIPTFRAKAGWMLEAWADLVNDVIAKSVRDG